MQPQAIMEPLFPTSTIHLIYLFTIPVKLEGGSVPNVLSCFWAFIDVCVYKGKLWKIIAQSTECWENLDTNGTPRSAIFDDSGGFGGFDVCKNVGEVVVAGSAFQVDTAVSR